MLAATKVVRRSVTIVGAGPAGCLVAAESAMKGLQVNWIDDQNFQSGTLKQYLSVPANTKTSHLEDLGFFDSPIQELAEKYPKVQSSVNQVFQNALPSPNNLKRIDPVHLSVKRNGKGGWPQIKDMQILFESCSDALCSMSNVTRYDGKAISTKRIKKQWHTRISDDSNDDSSTETTVSSDGLVFCCGGVPKSIPQLEATTAAGAQVISQSDALDIKVLSSLLTTRQPNKIAIIGNSHTSALVIRNLNELKYDSSTVQLFSRSLNVKIAKWIPSLNNYKYTANGLKGIAASFYYSDYENNEKSIYLDHNTTIIPTATTSTNNNDTNNDEENIFYEKLLNECDVIIPCVGFVPSLHPTINNDSISLQYDPSTSSLNINENLYECGMSQPEYFTMYNNDDDDDRKLNEYPSPAIHGGVETTMKGWENERLVSWSSFRIRSKQIVGNILKNSL
jgi:hypothetical protein